MPGEEGLLPEERARKKIDRQLTNAGWDIVSRDEYVPKSASAVKEALMKGNKESDYLPLPPLPEQKRIADKIDKMLHC